MDQHSQIHLTHITKDNECGKSARREIVGTDRSAELTLKPTCLSLCLNLDRFGAKTRNSAEYGDYSRQTLRKKICLQSDKEPIIIFETDGLSFPR